MDPESGAAIVQFTAPAAGTYSIGGEFSGIDQDQNSHPVEILDNGRAIFTGTIALYGQSDLFSLTETLKAGDQIDFAVLTGSGGCSYCYLSTGLSATITSAVPEPDMAWLMLAGMGGLVGFARMGNRLRFAWIRRSTIGESRS
jgi:hypothetical protein